MYETLEKKFFAASLVGPPRALLEAFVFEQGPERRNSGFHFSPSGEVLGYVTLALRSRRGWR